MNLYKVATIQAGYPFRGPVPLAPAGNARAVQMRDIDAHTGIAWNSAVVTQVDDKRDDQWLCEGDVLFAARGGRNYALAITEVPFRAVCSQYFFLIRIRDKAALLPEFLAWQINRAPAQRYFASNAEGTNQLSIRKGVLEAMPVALPAIQVQRSVIGLAQAVRRERACMEALLDNHERQLDVLAQDLLTNTPLLQA